MRNLTLDVFWLSFMPMYQHVIGTTTILLSVLVIYLVMTKTPAYGRPLARYLILMQLSIVLVDSWGFFYGPILLFPLVATLCDGLFCGSESAKHIGFVLLVQCMTHTALMLTYTLHYKYTTIILMTDHRRVTTYEKVAVRMFHWMILELPVIAMIMNGANQMDLREFLAEEEQISLISLLEGDNSVNGIAYSITRHQWIPIMLVALAVGSILITVGGCVFYVAQTLWMLSTATSMSEHTRQLQRGLTITLILQLTMPLIIQVVPLFFMLFSMVMFWFSPGWMNLALCVYLFHATFHSIFLIATTPSYRAAICCKSRQRKDTISSVRTLIVK